MGSSSLLEKKHLRHWYDFVYGKPKDYRRYSGESSDSGYDYYFSVEDVYKEHEQRWYGTANSSCNNSGSELEPTATNLSKEVVTAEELRRHLNHHHDLGPAKLQSHVEHQEKRIQFA